MKKFKLLLTTLIISSMLSITVLAGQWLQDGTGWWYQNDNGTYIVNDWQYIDGNWYCFNHNGYMYSNQWIGNYYVGSNGAMLVNTITPDGYRVGTDGAWVNTRPLAPSKALTDAFAGIDMFADSDTASLIDCGEYYLLTNAMFCDFIPSEEFPVYGYSSTYISKDAVVSYYDGTNHDLSVEEYLNIFGSYSSGQWSIRGLGLKIDSNGWIIGWSDMLAG